MVLQSVIKVSSYISAYTCINLQSIFIEIHRKITKHVWFDFYHFHEAKNEKYDVTQIKLSEH